MVFFFFLQKKEAPPRSLGGGEKWKTLHPREGHSWANAYPKLLVFIKPLSASKFNDTVQLAALITEQPRKDRFQVMGPGRGEA